MAQARRRNARAIAPRRMLLLHGDFQCLPYADASFNRVLMVNVAYFLSSAGTEIRDVRRLLKPRGRAVVTDRATMRH